MHWGRVGSLGSSKSRLGDHPQSSPPALVSGGHLWTYAFVVHWPQWFTNGF